MATEALANYLKSICEEDPTPASSVQSTTSAVIFFSYIGLALLLTGSIISYQAGAYQVFLSLAASPQSRINGAFIRPLVVRCLLAAVSFGVLSYHMILFLVDSYRQWILTAQGGGGGCVPSLGSQVWEWATRIPLFTVFANDVFKVKDADVVILLALAWEMMTVVSIMANGRQRNILFLWCYIFLAQILPISFVQNLFETARLRADITQTLGSQKDPVHAKPKNSQPWEQLEVFLSIPIYCCYGIVIGCLPFLQGTNFMMPGILLTRALLLVPFIISMTISPPRQLSARQSKVTALSTLTLVIAMAIPCLWHNDGQARHLYDGLRSNPVASLWRLLGESSTALQSNHAVAALGWDLVIGVISSIIYSFI